MKSRSLLFTGITLLGVLIGTSNAPARSAATIIKCKGQIPDKTACLIKPTSYKVYTYRVDLCQKNPFPSFRSSADYAGSKCMTLFNGNGNLYKKELAKGSRFKLPKTGREKIKPGTYNYLTMVFKNGFKSSGKYTSGNTSWRTMGYKDKKLNSSAIEISDKNPVEFEIKLSNWRGDFNKDNDYCNNNGGTPTRCDLNYNGYQITAIGLDGDFIEASGDQASYMFYNVDLSLPIVLKKDSDGTFDISANNNLEVYGNGNEVLSISIAPFIFQATFKE